LLVDHIQLLIHSHKYPGRLGYLRPTNNLYQILPGHSKFMQLSTDHLESFCARYLQSFKQHSPTICNGCTLIHQPRQDGSLSLGCTYCELKARTSCTVAASVCIFIKSSLSTWRWRPLFQLLLSTPL